MNIAIVGLGLIGGSLCKTIKKRTSHTVYGLDTDQDTSAAATEAKAIDAAITPKELRIAELTILCLTPQLTIDFILNHLDDFNPGSLVIDVCGIKKTVVDKVTAPLAEKGIGFLGAHPMAGREFSGFKYALDDLFDHASFIITPLDDTPKDRVELVSRFALELGFEKVVTATPLEHDSIIAYTSQLAHVVSNAYIKSPTLEKQSGFSAGSFLDMTRVAKLDEKLWSQLFILNREPLLFELDTLIQNLSDYRDVLKNSDKAALEKLLKEGRQLKEESLRRNESK